MIGHLGWPYISGTLAQLIAFALMGLAMRERSVGAMGVNFVAALEEGVQLTHHRRRVGALLPRFIVALGGIHEALCHAEA